jgi:hypothetical protein
MASITALQDREGYTDEELEAAPWCMLAVQRMQFQSALAALQLSAEGMRGLLLCTVCTVQQTNPLHSNIL